MGRGIGNTGARYFMKSLNPWLMTLLVLSATPVGIGRLIDFKTPPLFFAGTTAPSALSF